MPTMAAESTVYVLVFWPGDPEDRPPEVLAVAGSLDRAKRAAVEHARDQLHIDPPTEWTVTTEHHAEWVGGNPGDYIGQLQPEYVEGHEYLGGEERSYVIHPMTLL